MGDELKFGDEHPVADAIRKAIGVGSYDRVAVVSSPHEREDGKKVTFIPDKSKEFFDQLRKAPRDVLVDIGMGPWDEELLLFPAEWYDHIPEGYEVYSILEQTHSFRHGESSKDRRFGCLCYGFRMEKTDGNR